MQEMRGRPLEDETGRPVCSAFLCDAMSRPLSLTLHMLQICV